MGTLTNDDGLKTLIARGLERGYVTHDNIRECVPASAHSESQFVELVRLLSDTMDVFATTPSEEERRKGRMAIENEVFRRGVANALPEDD